MSQFSVNLSTIFTEVPFLDRFQRAKEAGFSYVECQFPYENSICDIQKALNENDLSMVLINLPPGDWNSGERGIAALPNRRAEFRESIEKGIEYASALKVKNIHCMAGIAARKEETRKTYIENLQYAGRKMAEYDLTLLIEPINSDDMPGYFLNDVDDAVQILKEVNLPNVKLQFDFYHVQKAKGNLLATFKKYFQFIRHVQIADVPGRHQPGTGEIHYENVFSYIDSLGYTGFVGLEYTPKGDSEKSFAWLNKRGQLF